MKRRKNTRLPYYDYTSQGAYFITIVTHLRAPLFGYIENSILIPSSIGLTAKQEWFAISSRIPGVKLDAFVLMPNHLHGIIWLTDETVFTLAKIMALYKAGVSRICQQSLWQRNFYERIIRDERELYFARQYIEQNPLRWELDSYYSAG
ncbi:transposase [Pantoea sp. B9002]|uniref:transposase n=1 Tax=Pantoea sp. B9002 TaxID=2726979 RepID=UPI0015A320C3|nr:transposase [Pantoea sp. B9002]NWA63121.1 transposase [Pantoea sp. B9002]